MIINLVIKNIKNSILEFRKVYLLMLLSQFVAIICIFFSYGIYGNYSAKMQELNIDSYSIGTSFENTKVVNIKECLPQLLNEFDYKLDYVFVGGFWNDTPVSMHFEYHNGMYDISKTVQDNIKLESGRTISIEDMTDGLNVVYSYRGETDEVGDIICIDSVDFEVIGVDEVAPGDLSIPFTASNNDIKVFVVIFNFRELPTQADYSIIKNTFEKKFGKNVSIDEFDIRDEEELISMKSIIVISVAIGIISALNTCLMYGYIISKRRKQMAVYGIIGASKGLRLAINELEIVIVSLVIEITGFLLYRCMLQAIITDIYDTNVSLYSFKSYGIMMLIYFICIFSITFVVLKIMNKKKLVKMLRQSG